MSIDPYPDKNTNYMIYGDIINISKKGGKK